MGKCQSVAELTNFNKPHQRVQTALSIAFCSGKNGRELDWKLGKHIAVGIVSMLKNT